MTYNLGAILVKGGKIISTGYNHHRTHYDGNEVPKHGPRKPVSMHAEMHAIYSLTGMSPPFKQQKAEASKDAFYGPSSEPFASKSAGGKRILRTQKKHPLDVPETAMHRSCGNLPDQVKDCDIRRRDPRVNGADIYVVRVVKNGFGSAQPCWRCVRWCHWSGIKRIFHWNSVERRFDIVKVNNLDNDVYETQADTRLFAGMAY
ncbi:hypothetical protein BJ138DRAFT_1113351 [Hygrophoropsis aurantiaca]|uniref:Uncharacterized protein n=2 Tax=Hygrophoropsis aurantiaca TaxID=72124 RepID=A0ACB8ADA5_9AGAM|nr:hypothetical protein BJ138DRAFT_1113453 [Hygrophoropsis aurantiaca]KAH7911247.1 hypothetical protein BJ138DRAFT_1113351 [Hygrophoropsis aurantiaca]